MKKTLNQLKLILLSALIVLVMMGAVRYVRYKDGLPILGYHEVVSDQDKEMYYKNNIYVMAVSDFEEQMKYLSENHFDTLTMDEINDYYEGKKELKKKSVAITFDDGMKSFNTMVKPILEKYKLRATCFVIAHKTELKNTQEKGKYAYLRKNDLVNDETVEYYSHSYDLHHKAGMFKKQMEVESYEYILDDFRKAEKIVSTKYFAFPYGRSSDNAEKVLKKENTTLAFGYAQNRNMIRDDNKYLLPRYLMYDFLPLTIFKWIVA